MEAKLLQSSSIEKNAALTGHYDRQDYKKKNVAEGKNGELQYRPLKIIP